MPGPDSFDSTRVCGDGLAMPKDSEYGGAASARERRQFGRFPTRLPISTRRDDLLGRGQDDGKVRCRLHLQDFSLGGLRADSPIPLKRNERLTLRLPPSGRHPGLNLTGRVVHCRRRDERYQVGIEFCQTGDAPATSPYLHLPRLFSVAAEFVDAPDPVASVDGI